MFLQITRFPVEFVRRTHAHTCTRKLSFVSYLHASSMLIGSPNFLPVWRTKKFFSYWIPCTGCKFRKKTYEWTTRLSSEEINYRDKVGFYMTNGYPWWKQNGNNGNNNTKHYVREDTLMSENTLWEFKGCFGMTANHVSNMTVLFLKDDVLLA